MIVYYCKVAFIFIQQFFFHSMKEAISSLKRSFRHWLITKTLVLLIRITGMTTRIKRNNQQVLKNALKEYGGVIVATWHQNIYFSVWLLKNQKLTALISNSNDGEVIYDVFSHFGYNAVRGSTTRGGIPALKRLIKLLKDKKSVAITPDGPLGPPEKIQSGVVLLAKYSGVPIIPWHYEAKNLWKLKSWDSHKIPKPFTTIVESFGEPFHVPKELLTEEVPEICKKLEVILKDLAHKTSE